jgi:hypothetical protein
MYCSCYSNTGGVTIDDEIEVVHADTSAYIALADATADW